jgi:NAD(P)-dependent dehydrogenase (short-subunit alcohol dehydrogenase family)
VAVALITGAAGGIGRAICQEFARHGCDVVGVDKAHPVQSNMDTDGIWNVPGDVTQESGMLQALEVAKDLGELKYLVCNAGLVEPNGPITAVSRDDYERVMSVNVWGVIQSIQVVLPTLLTGSDTSIVLVSSSLASVGRAGFALYSASKGALNALTRQLAVEYATANIRVNAVAPSGVLTEQQESRIRAMPPSSVRAELSRIPLGRLGRPEEVAQSVVWLCTTATFVTGTVLPLDGGVQAV